MTSRPAPAPTARDLMRSCCASVSPAMPARLALERLLQLSCGCVALPVLEDGRVVGMLTETGCMRALLRTEEPSADELTVWDVMTVDVAVVRPSLSLLQLASMSLGPRRSTVLLVDVDGELLGQISRRDLLMHAAAIRDAVERRGDPSAPHRVQQGTPRHLAPTDGLSSGSVAAVQQRRSARRAVREG